MTDKDYIQKSICKFEKVMEEIIPFVDPRSKYEKVWIAATEAAKMSCDDILSKRCMNIDCDGNQFILSQTEKETTYRCDTCGIEWGEWVK